MTATLMLVQTILQTMQSTNAVLAAVEYRPPPPRQPPPRQVRTHATKTRCALAAMNLPMCRVVRRTNVSSHARRSVMSCQLACRLSTRITESEKSNVGTPHHALMNCPSRPVLAQGKTCTSRIEAAMVSFADQIRSMIQKLCRSSWLQAALRLSVVVACCVD